MRLPFRKTWFYSWAMSYIWIFLFIVPLLMITLLVAFNDAAQKTAAESNKVFAKQMLQAVENEFRLIDNLISNEIASNDTMMDFYKKSLSDDRFYSKAKPADRLRDILTAMPLIDSIYLYRQYDGTVLTATSVHPVDQFNDKQVIVNALHQTALNRSWMSIRSGYSDEEAAKVISLVRYTPLFSGTDGVIVVNVRVESVVKLVQGLTASIPDHDIAILDRDGASIYSDSAEGGYLASEYSSDYLGWTIQNGVAGGNLFRVVSTLSKYWIFVCLLFCLLGILWIVLVSRKNYKPVQQIIDRIQRFTEQKRAELFRKDSTDEFKFIDSALENLFAQAGKYQEQYEENLFYRRKTFFVEWLEGDRPLKPEQWRQEMARLELPHSFAEIVVSIIKLNKYAAFTEAYSRHDQNLLKFALSSVVKEVAEPWQVAVWAEWIANDRLVVANLVSAAHAGASEALVKDLADAVVRWVSENLHFTVSIGIGSAADQIEYAQQSCEEAKEALAFCPSFGDAPVIGYWQIQSLEKRPTVNPLPFIHELAGSFRTGEGEWGDSFERMFAELRNGLYAREEIANLVNYLVFYMHKALTALPSELQEVWAQEGAARLERAAAQWDTLDELQEQLRDILLRMAQEMADIRSNRGSYKLVRDMRTHIEENYGNPDLSLQHLSETFGVHVKTVSRMFKEEIGVNFIDFLSQVRAERAKDLLSGTDRTIQEIAAMVGYLHPNTFIRSFKKQAGTTPGDYRKSVGNAPG